jgi:hemerythrin
MPIEDLKNNVAYNLFKSNLLIVWRPEYELSIPIIDEQHRGIVSTINSLLFGVQNKHGQDVLKPVIDMVKDYTLVHFKVEEDFLMKYNFPGAGKHKELHDALVHDLLMIGKKSLWDKDPLEFLNFLKKWWIEHILEKDREFLNFFMKTMR